MKKILQSSLIIILLLSVVACNRSKKNEVQDDAQTENTDNQLTTSGSQSGLKTDVYEAGFEPLRVVLLGHSSIMIEYNGKVIHVDPYSEVADYNKLPKADYVLLTHEDGDHLDQRAIGLVKKAETQFILTKACNKILGYGDVLNNGQFTERGAITIAAVPAYNIVNKKVNGEPYHPRGVGNGYVLSFRDKKVYIAGDTENIPEMDGLRGEIDIAFLPKNLPYTMTDEMFIDAARRIMPKVLYPYHMTDFDSDKISRALEGTGIKLEVRPMSSK